MDNNRKQDRYKCMAYCGVFDIATENHLGILIDLSLNGLRVMGEEKLRSGKVFNLRLEMAKKVNDSKIIYVSATCNWSEKSKEPKFYISGFEFDNPEELTEKQLEAHLHSSVFVKIEETNSPTD